MKSGLSGVIDDLINQVPSFVRGEIENLRRTEVTIGKRQNVAFRFVGVGPIAKVEVFDLMGSFSAPDRRE